MSEVIDQKAQELAVEAEKILATATGFAVTTTTEYQAAGEELKRVKAKAKEVDGQRAFLKAPVLEQAKRIEDFFRAPLKFLTDAESILKRAMLTFQQAEEAKRQEAERRAQEAARREQEVLRRKAAEEERKAAEKADDLRRQAEEAAAAGRASEAAKLTAKAETIIEKATDKSENLQEQAQSVLMPTIASEQPKVAGISTRKVWKARVIDPRKVPREYLVVNEKMLDAFAKATKGAVPVDGIEFYSEDVMAAGGRAA
jgi:colicin import membrane protein